MIRCSLLVLVLLLVAACAYSGSGPASITINRYLDLSAITSATGATPAASAPKE